MQAPASTTSSDQFHNRWRWSLLRTTPCPSGLVSSGSWVQKFFCNRGKSRLQLVTALTKGDQDRTSTQLEILGTRYWFWVFAPGWRDFVNTHFPRPGQNDMDDGERGSRFGWQVGSSMCLEHQFVATFHGLVFAGRPRSECSFHQFPNFSPQPIRLSAVPRASSTPLFGSFLLRVLVCMACHSILVATTAQRVLWQGFWDVGVSQWEVRPHGFVARQGARVGERLRVGHGRVAQPLSGTVVDGFPL